MKIAIDKGIAQGKIYAAPSKSVTHRVLICAALSEGTTIIKNISFSDDICATISCIKALGAKVIVDKNFPYTTQTITPTNFFEKNFSTHTLTIIGIGGKPSVFGTFNCRDSASTLRFILPLALLATDNNEDGACFKCSKRLLERGISVYEEIFYPFVTFDKTTNAIFVKGSLQGKKYSIRDNSSSQFISGLLFVLPLCKENSEIEILSPIESFNYIELTIDVLSKFGINIQCINKNAYFIKGGQTYKSPRDSKNITNDIQYTNYLDIEGDWSNAAFLLALNLLGGDVIVDGLLQGSKQGDKKCLDFFHELFMKYTTIDLKDHLDLAPILFIVAATHKGGHFIGTKRLKLKESNRALAMKEELKKFGVNIVVDENSVTIPPSLNGIPHTPMENLSAHADHRTAMALAILCTMTGGIIEDAEVVQKSYPKFFDDLASLNIKTTIL